MLPLNWWWIGRSHKPHVKLVKLVLYTQPTSSMNNCSNLHLKSFFSVIILKRTYWKNRTWWQMQIFLFKAWKTFLYKLYFWSKGSESIRCRRCCWHFCFQPERMQTFKSFVCVPLCSDKLGLNLLLFLILSYLLYSLGQRSMSGHLSLLQATAIVYCFCHLLYR